MPSTYYSLHNHYVFSTKERHPFLDEKIIHQAHEYLGGIIRGLGAKPVMIGGVDDHVHLLIGQKTTHCPADLIREIKKASTDWLRVEQPDFSWQEGYGAFSVSPERLDAVSRYIAKQPEHHAKKTYREEWIELLKYARIEFDESQFD